MNINVFKHELSRNEVSITHVELPLEVTFEGLNDDRAIICLYKQRSEIFMKAFSMEASFELYEELSKANEYGQSPYSWRTILENKDD